MFVTRWPSEYPTIRHDVTLRDQLQQALGATLTVERELGGGGMSRVFLAQDRALGRQVVVKVLPPELTAGVNVERFNREILLAAKLQHPHIVPVLAAGSMDGLPWFTMPFVEGESLRSRLERGTALSITETVGLLRDVAKALAYAHEHGIVHRDIKPDNVLLTGGSATVADFGIAKAISASRTEGGQETLTQIGTSIGTPAYMSPEQAAGDPETDHRADLYSFGCLAYEMLTGRPPFIEKSPRKLLAAHMGERPVPVQELRLDTPGALAELVMRCLEKEADARPQQARDLVRVLETVTTGGTAQPAMPAMLLGGAGMLKRALVYWALGVGIVAIVAQGAIVGIGLPTWVLPGALLVMAFGLPVILWTAYVHRVVRRVYAATPQYTPGGTPALAQGTMATIALKASPHMSWHRTARGGMIAMGAFVALIAGFMTLRALGIGPAGSLFAAGTLSERDRLVMADFEVSGADSSLGRVVSAAVRAGLSQSRILNLLSPSDVASGLRRMQRPITGLVDVETARALALRDGAKAVVGGTVTLVGGSYIVEVRLVSADSARELASFRATAAGPGEVIAVADELARKLRSRAGESLRDVNASRPLVRATTASLEALRKYSEAVWANDVEGDYAKAIRLLRESTGIDSMFTEAWRKLGVALSNYGAPAVQRDSALRRAYALRDRLPDDEREYLIGYYFTSGPGNDRSRGIAAYERLLARGDSTALHNLGVILRSRREFARADSMFSAVLRRTPRYTLSAVNLYWNRFAAGDVAGMDSIAAMLKPLDGTEATLALHAAQREVFLGSVPEATSAIARYRSVRNPSDPTNAMYLDASLRGRQGRVREARASVNEAIRVDSASDRSPFGVTAALQRLALVLEHGGDSTAEVRALEALLARGAMEEVPEVDRPYLFAADMLVIAGRLDLAKEQLARFAADVRDTAYKRGATPYLRSARGSIAQAERRWADAARELRAGDSLPDGPANMCGHCLPLRLVELFAVAGLADSAVAAYEVYRATSMGSRRRTGTDLAIRTPLLESLGRMFEQIGDTARAIEAYRDLIERWKEADPEFQPRVVAARKRLSALTPVERPRR